MSRAIDAGGQMLLAGIVAGALFGVPTAHNLLSAGTPVPPANIEDAEIVEGDGAPSIARAADGLFYTQVRIDGIERRCLIDSGATGMVLDAGSVRRTKPIRFSGRLLTAGGSRPAARIRLASLRLAGHDLHGVTATLVAGGNISCLLGQEVLARLDAVELSGNRLTLR